MTRRIILIDISLIQHLRYGSLFTVLLAMLLAPSQLHCANGCDNKDVEGPGVHDTTRSI
ncbi:unnamed protein product [Penicillium camemberti]|uniref:Str. FM013 n=1 Tax=Penicillium camemberti (strain FM 013) TaxID=1429867 RepID=A0A0G4PCY4_PENC3|nr:unnamed protein product [Penicillium camemberti]